MERACQNTYCGWWRSCEQSRDTFVLENDSVICHYEIYVSCLSFSSWREEEDKDERDETMVLCAFGSPTPHHTIKGHP
jgi:hypothetical protein